MAVERPFVLWTPGELRAIRHRIETRPWARAEWERKPENRAEAALHDLLAYRLFGDREAGERQARRLVKTVRSKPPLGGAQWINVVTFDMARDLLDDGEREEVEAAFRRFIDTAVFRNSLFDPDVFNTSRNYQRYDAKFYTRSNWLPNITWPRRVSANLMAAALGDEALIRKVWSHYGSWQWYFDEYLSDGGFYGEEFSKMGATPGAMLIYCRAVRHLGLDELGFGYRGRRGSSMRGHIESLVFLGYPRVLLCSGRPQYPMLTTGDLRGSGSSRQGKNLPTYAFQHSLVRGYLPGPAARGIQRWQAHGAWGGEVRGNNPQWDGYSGFTPKMQIPLWFEAGQATWPDAGFKYFLAQMRAPGQAAYVPSLYFGLDPIEPAAVKPPRAPSWVAPDRGLAMLRADESPAYWESPKPAAGVRLAASYAHSVNDSLTLSGLYAFNRPIYLNRQTRRGYAFGYSRSVLSHAGVMVDGREPAFTRHTVTRHGLYPPVKFLCVESSRVYAGIDATRALILTGRYLLDVFRLAGDGPAEHDFIWVVHALGQPAVAPSDRWRGVRLDGPLSVFQDAREAAPASPNARVTVIQGLSLEDPSKAKLPRAWYDRKVGVQAILCGKDTTRLYTASTPIDDVENRKLKSPDAYLELQEVGGTSIIARRKAPRTCFVVLHAPFEGGKAPPLEATEHATGSEAVVAVEVTDSGAGTARDWLLLDLRGEKERRQPYPVEILPSGHCLFAGHGFVRIAGDRVDAWGDVRGLRVRLDAPASGCTLRVNGRITRASAEGDVLYYPQRNP